MYTPCLATLTEFIQFNLHKGVFPHITGGVDYDNAPLVAMFNAGDSTAIVTIPVMSDTVIEEDEMFYVNIDMVDVTEAEVELGTLTNATAIILDSSKYCTLISSVVYCTLQHSTATNYHTSSG